MTLTQGADENARTLRYWSQVEALTAPDAEAHDERGDDFVITYLRNESLPWQEKLLALPHKHFVRFGVIPRRSYEAELLETLEPITSVHLVQNCLTLPDTRAQRRLYVIGDRSRWMRQDLARALASHMPRVPGDPNGFAAKSRAAEI